MATALHPVIVATVKSVISEGVQLTAVKVGAAATRLQNWQTESVRHHHPERS